jgi:hypothetical protein
MAKKGYFILTDISGYTEFLTKSELDHAQYALQSLFDVQLAHIKHPFIISGFRGDAIFMYVPETNFCAPQTLLEALENIYFVFADTLRQMIYNTTCACRACQNMKHLDLKMVIHYGEYAIQKLGDREELLGADVIVPHRMLKNHVTGQTGVTCYALFSEAAAEALNLPELAYPLVPYSEAYEHIGEVKMQILDLHKVWEREQDRKRFVVPPDEAWINIEYDLPYPPIVVWEYLTNLDIELKFQGYDLVERTDVLGGRIQQQSTYHCAHGEVHFFNTILDWRPFEYLSIRQEVAGLVLVQTRTITPAGSGTRLGFYIARPPSPGADEMKEMILDTYREAGMKFRKFLESDIGHGVVTLAAGS